MRSSLILGIVGLCISFPSSLLADAVAPDRVQDTISKLGSDRFPVREKAAKALEAMGEPALESLRKAASSEDADLRRRIELVIQNIEKESENRKNLTVTKYRFQFENEQLSSAIAQINRKTKLQFYLDEKLVANPKRTITLDTGEVTIWEAVAKFMEAANLKDNDNPVANQPQLNGMRQRQEMMIWNGGRAMNPNVPQNRIVLMDGKMDSPLSASGLLRVRALAKEQGFKNRGSSEIDLTLDVLTPLQANWRGILGIDITRAIDENGQSLSQSYLKAPPSFNPNIYDNAWGGGMQFQQLAIDLDSPDPQQMGPYNPRHLPITLLAGKKSSKSLQQLEGVIHSRIMTPPQALITIEDVAKVSAKDVFRSGSISLQILQVDLNPKKGQAFVRYRMESAGNNQNDFGLPGGGFIPLGGIAMNSDLVMGGESQPTVTLQDGSGKALPRTRLEMLSGSGINVITWSQEYQILFSSSTTYKSPLKLVATGQKQVEVSVPFALKNVQLP